MFVKHGDPIRIKQFIKSDKECVVCHKCEQPLVTVAIDEDDKIKIICECEHPEVEQLNAQDIG